MLRGMTSNLINPSNKDAVNLIEYSEISVSSAIKEFATPSMDLIYLPLTINEEKIYGTYTTRFVPFSGGPRRAHWLHPWNRVRRRGMDRLGTGILTYTGPQDGVRRRLIHHYGYALVHAGGQYHEQGQNYRCAGGLFQRLGGAYSGRIGASQYRGLDPVRRPHRCGHGRRGGPGIHTHSSHGKGRLWQALCRGNHCGLLGNRSHYSTQSGDVDLCARHGRIGCRTCFWQV